MFRSAADSSSDSQVSSDENDNNVLMTSIHSERENPRIPQKEAKTPPITTGTGHGQDTSSSEHDLPSPSGLPDVDAGGHANLMTAALLEFYCLSRAADILNAQEGSHRRFTRDSSEVQYLGKKMYAFKSQFLSSHGVLVGGVDKEELGTTRQYYRDNLDLLGVSALEDLNLDDGNRRSPTIGASTDLALTSKSSKSMRFLAEKQYAEPTRPEAERGEGLDLQRLISGRNSGLMQDIRLDLGNLPTQPLPLSRSSPVSFPLFSAHPHQPINHMSRYEMEFSEVKVLGRGSFGEVYHVKNHIDGQSYAVKKIPLSQKRLEQLQFGGQNQLENIMKEIRTLARLEHTNVVRYYGAWVEQAHVAGHLPPEEPSSHGLHHEESQNTDITQESAENPSFGIVFEDSESSLAEAHSSSASTEYETRSHGTAQRRYSHATTASHRSRRSFGHSIEDDDEEIESIPRDFTMQSQGQLSTFGGTDDDIFTDGLSQDPSKLQIQRRHRSGAQIPAVVLHIQMSLHPISLSSYLNPQPERSGEAQSPSRRHCFHLIPSLKLMLDIISGVEYLHTKGIVHRDLKPANIFLSSPENHNLQRCGSCQSDHESVSHYCHPRIGDFGLVADISHLNVTPSDSPVTPSNEGPNVNRIVGTEFYRPPQGSVGDSSFGSNQSFCTVDEKLDIFALGVILFELLYRLNTKMERQLVLNDLTRGSNSQSSTVSPTSRTSFPSDFVGKIDMGQMMLDDETSIGESLMACIEGMLEPQPQQPLNCSFIKSRLEGILAATQKVL
ncbi:hypothetical protein MW887_011183 [Aspergillus wentii]|nr:hypothetical protein MW887_011183 [Aspergillus wentii]